MKKIVIVIYTFVIVVFLSGCNKGNNFLYNAVMVASGAIPSSHNEFIFNDSFLEDNIIGGALYKNDNYDSNDPKSEKFIYIDDSMAPKRIIKVIDSIEVHDLVFNKKIEVDFDKEILILFLFSSTNCSYSLNEVKIEDNILQIVYNYQVNYNTEPERTCILIKMDKIEYEKIEFTGKKKETKHIFGNKGNT